MQSKNIAGIDVSSKTLEVVIRKRGKSLKSKSFKNTHEGHATLINFLKKREVTQVCLEATNVYHLDISVEISRLEEIDIMIVNPRASKHFAEALMKRSKTDPQDADVLAQYIERMEFKAWKPPADEVLVVRACARRLACLAKQRARAKNHLHALRATKLTPEFIIEDAELSIAQLEKQIHDLMAHALDIIKADESLLEVLVLVTSIKGIAEKTAIQLIGELAVLPSDMTPKQWVAFAGLDPKRIKSGTSIDWKMGLSKAGNRYVRMALYMPALNASRFEPHICAYYQHLIQDNGITKLQAICAVMRKLLHAIHGMLKSGSSFDGKRFYTIPEKAAV